MYTESAIKLTVNTYMSYYNRNCDLTDGQDESAIHTEHV